ncbi:YjiG family protein [Pseudescherichia vulneris]
MTTQAHKNVMDMFIDGARRGFTIATTSLLPNVVMAFVIIQALKVTGLLEIVGKVCEPIMALWGLPGEAATVLLAAVMSMGGGVGVCASLIMAGSLNGHDATVLLPAIYLMGNPVQNVGRCLGTAGVLPKYYPHIIAVCVINALLSIWVMQLIV